MPEVHAIDRSDNTDVTDASVHAARNSMWASEQDQYVAECTRKALSVGATEEKLKVRAYAVVGFIACGAANIAIEGAGRRTQTAKKGAGFGIGRARIRWCSANSPGGRHRKGRSASRRAKAKIGSRNLAYEHPPSCTLERMADSMRGSVPVRIKNGSRSRKRSRFATNQLVENGPSTPTAAGDPNKIVMFECPIVTHRFAS